MQRPERRPTDNYKRVRARMRADKRNHFLVYIIVELLMTDDLVTGIHMIVHPTFGIDAVDGKYFYFSIINEWPKDVDELKPLVFQEISGSSRHQQQCESIRAVHSNGHVL